MNDLHLSLTYIGWIVAGLFALLAAWLWGVAEDERARRARQQIRAEEADALADNHERTAAGLPALPDRQATIDELQAYLDHLKAGTVQR